MSTQTNRRIYIDRDAAREEAIIRRVLIAPTQPQTTSAATAQRRQNAARLFGVGRLVRGQLLRRPR